MKGDLEVHSQINSTKTFSSAVLLLWPWAWWIASCTASLWLRPYVSVLVRKSVIVMPTPFECWQHNHRLVTKIKPAIGDGMQVINRKEKRERKGGKKCAIMTHDREKRKEKGRKEEKHADLQYHWWCPLTLHLHLHLQTAWSFCRRQEFQETELSTAYQTCHSLLYWGNSWFRAHHPKPVDQNVLNIS